jgi:hypothetical protein
VNDSAVSSTSAASVADAPAPSPEAASAAAAPRILYCHCAYAQVVPKEVKEAVLARLCDSGAPFDAVADLCEMSARRDPALAALAREGRLKIAACFPRAVKWLFASAEAPRNPEGVEILNMRVESAEDVAAALSRPDLRPNLPPGKTSISDAPVTANPSPTSLHP